MTDTEDSLRRRKNMVLVKSKNSKAEMLVFKHLRQRGIYFQKHYARAPGKPDVALPRKKMAIFIDGDFWHGRTYQALILRRKSDDYWVRKVTRNMERDKIQRDELLSQGWKVLTVWESDINRKSTRENALAVITDFLLGS